MNESFFHNIASRWAIVGFLVPVIIFKVFATSATNGGGGTGGVFAPTLFLGCIAGFVFFIYTQSVRIYYLSAAGEFRTYGYGGSEWPV